VTTKKSNDDSVDAAPRFDAVTQRWVCMGHRRATDGKLYQWWVEQKKGGELSGEHCFKKPLVKYSRPGAIYEITCSPDGNSVYTKGKDAPRYVEILNNTALIIEWRALEESDETTARVAARMRKELSADELRRVLEPIRRAYQKTDRTGRRAIKVLVLEYLENGI
jgi:hypothetical protein